MHNQPHHKALDVESQRRDIVHECNGVIRLVEGEKSKDKGMGVMMKAVVVEVHGRYVGTGACFGVGTAGVRLIRQTKVRKTCRQSL